MASNEDELDFDNLIPAPDPVYGNTEQVRRQYSQGLGQINPVTQPPVIDQLRLLDEHIHAQGRAINERAKYLQWLSMAIRAVPPDDETAMLIGRTIDNMYL